MEASGIVLGPFQVGGFNTHDSKSNLCIKNQCFGEIKSVDMNKFGIEGCRRFMRKFPRVMSNGFCDKGHVQYYNYKGKSPVYDAKKKEREKEKKIKKNMKKLKLLRGSGQGFLRFSQMGFADDGVVSGDLLVGENQDGKLWDTADVQMKRLEVLKAEKKELKRLRKVEKAKVKAERMTVMMDSESSSTSSESSDSECDEIVDMNRLRTEASCQPCCEGTPLPNSSTEIDILPKVGDSSIYNTCCSSVNNAESDVRVSYVAPMKKIEVCMGNKCKKSGAAALLAEFERAVGLDGEVVGCKCMGKCRDGPNVRLVSPINEVEGTEENDSVRVPGNPLCIGVGLEDVGVIVSNFLAKSTQDLGLTPAV